MTTLTPYSIEGDIGEPTVVSQPETLANPASAGAPMDSNNFWQLQVLLVVFILVVVFKLFAGQSTVEGAEQFSGKLAYVLLFLCLLGCYHSAFLWLFKYAPYAPRHYFYCEADQQPFWQSVFFLFFLLLVPLVLGVLCRWTENVWKPYLTKNFPRARRWGEELASTLYLFPLGLLSVFLLSLAVVLIFAGLYVLIFRYATSNYTN